MLEIRISIERVSKKESLRRRMVFSWDDQGDVGANGQHFDGLLVVYIDSWVERFRVAARLSAGLAHAHGASELSMTFTGRRNAWGKWSHWKRNGESEVLREMERMSPVLAPRINFDD